MGRLLRKKDPVRKKKKPGDEKATESNISVAQPVSSPDSSNDAAKKQIIPQKKTPAASKPLQSVSENKFIEKVFVFLREVKAELKKVVWPSRKQTMGSTLVVIILVMIISFFLGLVDIGLSSLVRVVLH